VNGHVLHLHPTENHFHRHARKRIARPLAGEDEIALMLVTLFRKGAVDEARRPDCWLVIEAEMDHIWPRPELIVLLPLPGERGAVGLGVLQRPAPQRRQVCGPAGLPAPGLADMEGDARQVESWLDGLRIDGRDGRLILTIGQRCGLVPAPRCRNAPALRGRNIAGVAGVARVKAMHPATFLESAKARRHLRA
jgi:hypothetical protein